MEKRGCYRKGRQGHARNINPYLIFRNRMKKWKYPFIGMGVLLLFMLSFDITGDLFKADVLRVSGEPEFSITDANLDIAKKGFALILKNEFDECKKFKIQECVSQAQNLENGLQFVDTKEAATDFSLKLQQFIDSFASQKMRIACKTDLTQASDALNNYLNDFEKYASEYSEIFTLRPGLLKKLKTSVADLEELIQYCDRNF